MKTRSPGRIPIRSSLAFCEVDSHKINLLDTPGYNAFIQASREAIRIADTAVVVVDATSGVEVQTEKVWNFANEVNLPRIIVLNKVDRDNADIGKAMESIHEAFGREVVLIQTPIGKENNFSGVVDLIDEKAYLFADDTGKYSTADVPAEMQDETATRREELIEMVAESDEQLMEKFFEEGTLTGPELKEGLRKAILEGAIVPVICASAALNFGTATLIKTAN